MATLAYIDLAGVTNDWLRAAAGAHRLCVGYPDGVPETWRTPSACAGDATECRVEWHETRGKHFMDETRDGHAELERALRRGDALIADPDAGDGVYMCNAADMLQLLARGGAGGGAAYPEHELDPAALAPEPPTSNSAVLGFSRLSSHWLEFEAKRNARIVNVSAPGYDPAALLGPVAEPVDWPERDAAGDEEC